VKKNHHRNLQIRSLQNKKILTLLLLQEVKLQHLHLIMEKEKMIY
jgi:hypothetical protein